MSPAQPSTATCASSTGGTWIPNEVVKSNDRWNCSLARMSRPRPDYSGMTVNERLSAAGLLPQWDAAIAAGDRQRAIDVLGRIDMDETRASPTVDATLGDPSKYGFPPSR